jgi:hypothetical protein
VDNFSKNEKKAPIFSGDLIVQLITNDVMNWEEKYNGFVHNLKATRVEPIINTSIQGNYNKVLSQTEREIFINSMFERLGAEVMEGLRSESVVSLSGYTKELK